METKKKSGLAILIGMGKPKDGGPKDTGETMSEGMHEVPDSQSTEESKGQYIKPPVGFKPPDDKTSGESFTGTFRAHLDENGNLCFDAINDIPMHSEESETPEQESEESPGEESSENEMNMEEPSPEDDEMTARRKFDKVMRRK